MSVGCRLEGLKLGWQYKRGMLHVLKPIDLLLIGLAGWANEHQHRVIEYLLEENRVLRELHGKKRLRFTDDQRRRLAAKG